MKDKINKFSLIDIETTGSLKKGQKIIEIAILNIDGDELVEEYSTLINPEIRIPYFITNLTGITNEAVEHSPKFYEVAKKIVEMTKDRVFVAHNVFFDFNFIKHEFAELGFSYLRDKLCTVQLARKYLPGHKSYSLGELAKDLSITVEGRHRALGDASATFELFKMIQKAMGTNDELLSDSKKLALPPLLNRESFERLPHLIGVYYFYNSSGEILYIGKSLDIKKRVTQHFHPNLKRRKDIELKNLVARIEFFVLPHELAALVYECMEIKKHYPRYNVSLKRRRFSYALKLKLSTEGVYEIVLTHNDGTFHPLFAVKSKKTGQLRMDSLYRNMIGAFENTFEKEAKLNLLIKKLGADHFNRLLEKVFYQKVPKHEDFEVPFMVKNQNLGSIKIRGFRPVEMVIRDEEGDENFYPLPDDPDLASIVCNFLI